jgi:hypothetical protein
MLLCEVYFHYKCIVVSTGFRKSPEVGVDFRGDEFYPFRSETGKQCYIQISDMKCMVFKQAGKDYGHWFQFEEKMYAITSMNFYAVTNELSMRREKDRVRSVSPVSPKLTKGKFTVDKKYRS